MPDLEKLKSVLKSIQDAPILENDILKGLTKSEREIVDTLYRENLLSEALDFLEDLDTEEEWNQFLQKMNASKKRVVPFWKPLLKYAAIFIGLMAIGYTVYQNQNIKNEIPISETAIKLKMGGDEVKVIKEGESQQIISTSGKVLGVQKGNKISYSANLEMDELVYNELEIPFGKIFDVELSDGTLVHLNSGTKMRYPVKFLNKGKREVFIEGEAYFKVAKDVAHPFVVHAEEVAVEVLGTEFNLSSYKEDAEIKTVLVEGSVNMSNTLVPADNVVLVPGKKGAWNKESHHTTTEDVDVTLYTGWIRGELVFKNTSFSTMAKKLERSYNVTIQNNNRLLGDKILNAHFHVNIESIEDVMKSVGEIYSFGYTIKEGKITID